MVLRLGTTTSRNELGSRLGESCYVARLSESWPKNRGFSQNGTLKVLPMSRYMCYPCLRACVTYVPGLFILSGNLRLLFSFGSA